MECRFEVKRGTLQRPLCSEDRMYLCSVHCMKSNTWTNWIKLHKKHQGMLVKEKPLCKFGSVEKQAVFHVRKERRSLSRDKVVPSFLPITLPTLGSDENRIPAWTCLYKVQHYNINCHLVQTNHKRDCLSGIRLLFYVMSNQMYDFLHFRFGRWFQFLALYLRLHISSLFSPFNCILQS
jgi:hypothetical protein